MSGSDQLLPLLTTLRADYAGWYGRALERFEAEPNGSPERVSWGRRLDMMAVRCRAIDEAIVALAAEKGVPAPPSTLLRPPA